LEETRERPVVPSENDRRKDKKDIQKSQKGKEKMTTVQQLTRDSCPVFDDDEVRYSQWKSTVMIYILNEDALDIEWYGDSNHSTRQNQQDIG